MLHRFAKSACALTLLLGLALPAVPAAAEDIFQPRDPLADIVQHDGQGMPIDHSRAFATLLVYRAADQTWIYDLGRPDRAATAPASRVHVSTSVGLLYFEGDGALGINIGDDELPLIISSAGGHRGWGIGQDLSVNGGVRTEWDSPLATITWTDRGRQHSRTLTDYLVYRVQDRVWVFVHKGKEYAVPADRASVVLPSGKAEIDALGRLCLYNAFDMARRPLVVSEQDGEWIFTQQ